MLFFTLACTALVIATIGVVVVVTETMRAVQAQRAWKQAIGRNRQSADVLRDIGREARTIARSKTGLARLAHSYSSDAIGDLVKAMSAKGEIGAREAGILLRALTQDSIAGRAAYASKLMVTGLGTPE